MTCVVGFTSVLMLGAAVRLLGHPLNWCNDVALLMLAWTTFLGGDVAFRAGRMVNVDILIAKLPVRFQKGRCRHGICCFIGNDVHNGKTRCPALCECGQKNAGGHSLSQLRVGCRLYSGRFLPDVYNGCQNVCMT